MRQGAAWDYKVQSIWEANFPNVKYFGMDNKRYRFNGEEICPTDFGNINFGYAGLAFGFEKEVLLFFAGVFQLLDHVLDHGAEDGTPGIKGNLQASIIKAKSSPFYGDQEDDYIMTNRGMDLYNSGF